jgi:CheY-like chemotaxis protein
MNKSALIMVVDDEPANRKLIEGALKHEFDIHCVNSGNQCLEEVEEVMPDVILMDIMMPGIDGYETCEYLKRNEKTRQIPIIFVSALDNINDRLTAYKIQGMDYIVKPFNLQELISKVKVAVNIKLQYDQLISDIQNATKKTSAVTSMSDESSIISQFIDTIFSCNSYQELANEIFKSVKTLGLNGAFQINPGDDQFYFNPEGLFKAHENELINFVRSKGKIFSYEARIFINYDHSTVFIKDMPLDDPDKYAYLRDHLVIMGIASNARCIAIKTQLELEKHQDSSEAMLVMESTINNFQQNSSQNSMKILTINQRMAREIEDKLSLLGIKADQSNKLMHIINHSTQEITTIIDNQKLIEDSISDLKKLISLVNNNSSLE